MKSQYLKKNCEYTNIDSIHDCKKKCKQNCKKCKIGEYDWSTYNCTCYEESDKNNYDKLLFEIKHDNKKKKVNKIAFWVTFSFFMIVVAILIFFFY